MAKATQKHVVCHVDELPPGARRIVRIHGRSIGVFNIDGELRALRNICPHHGAPLCLGQVTGTMLESEPQQYAYDAGRHVLRCPWHGYEFDMERGTALVDSAGMAVRTYEVSVEGREVVIHV